MTTIHMLIQIVIIGLASYRITMAFVYDWGPFDAFDTLRGQLGVYDLDENGRPELTLGKMFGCPSCLGFWVTLVVLIFVLNGWLMTVWVLFAAAGIQHYLSQRYMI